MKKMDMQILPWIKDDIAIEIIGKMIAEQTEQLYSIAAEYKQTGISFDSEQVKTDDRYQKVMNRIGEFKQEIDQIYDGERVENLYQKVEREYVPYLNSLRSYNANAPINRRTFTNVTDYGSVNSIDQRELHEGNTFDNDWIVSIKDGMDKVSINGDSGL